MADDMARVPGRPTPEGGSPSDTHPEPDSASNGSFEAPAAGGSPADVPSADVSAPEHGSSVPSPEDTLRVPSVRFPGTDGGDAGACAPEVPEAPAARRAPAALAGVLAVGCAVLIAVSLGFVRPAADGSWSLTWVFGASESSSAVETGSAEGSTEDAAADGSADGGRADGGRAEQDAAAQASGAKGDASSDGASAGASASGTGADSSGSGGSSSGSKGEGSTSHAGSTGGASSSGGNASAPAPDPDTVTVTVSVDSSAADGSVSGGGTFTFERGATAYDALLACGLTVGAEDSPMGIYVYSIGGLAEKQFGGGSGWNYAVNGSTPGFSCGVYELSDGDAVRWFYVTG